MNEAQYYFSDLLKPYLEKEFQGKGIDCVDKTLGELIAIAHTHEVKTHFLKRLDNPRMQWALGKLKGLWPANILDIGSGNGYLLWYLREHMPGIHIFAADRNRYKITRIGRVAGHRTIFPECCDGEMLPFKDNSFDAVSCLEVLEHTPDPAKLIAEAIRVTRRWVVASVPSKEDNNPEHIHLFNKDRLIQLFERAGGKIAEFDGGVPNHLCWLAKKNHGR